eukprot:COSAG01_NODE_71535_length_255_cov_1.326923_1_plen_40_part_10
MYGGIEADQQQQPAADSWLWLASTGAIKLHCPCITSGRQG